MGQGEALEWRDPEVPAFKTCKLLWWKQRVAFQDLLHTQTVREGGCTDAARQILSICSSQKVVLATDS
jgi:hypothetical protein